MDKITTLISSILCAAMMIILFANVVLRLIPSVGGFKWYMESSQYLNVWSMLIACVGINAMGTNLRVEVVDSIFGRTALGKKLVVLIRDVFIILFYVYTIFPIAGVICIIGAVVNLIVELTEKPEGGDKE